MMNRRTNSNPNPNPTPALVRVARWSATHRLAAIALWLVFVTGCFALGAATGTREPSAHQLGVGESGRAADLIRAGGLTPPAVEDVLVTPLDGTVALAAAHAGTDPATAMDVIAQDVRTELLGLGRAASIASVAEPVRSTRGRAVLVAVTIAGDPATAADRLAPLSAAVARLQHSHPMVRIEQVGAASLDNQVATELGRSFRTAAAITLPLTLVILVVAFGAIVAAGIPVILGLSSVLAAIGLSELVSHLVPSTPTINEVILLIGMAVGVDYSLFYLKREREERAKGRSRASAIEVAAATSGRTVLISGTAVMVSMAGLYLTRDVTFASLASGSIIVVAVAMLGSLTVLPALLTTFGRALDRPRVPLLWRLTNRDDREPRVWSSLLRPALRHPLITLVASAGALIALTLPAATLSLHSTTVEDLPRSIPAVQSYHRLVAEFPAQAVRHDIVVHATVGASEAVQRSLVALAARAARDPMFGPQQAEVVASRDGTVQLLALTTPYAPDSSQARESLHRLRATLVPAELTGIPGVEYAVGGDVAANVDSDRQMRAELPWVIGFVLLLTVVMMLRFFRSVVVALTAIAVNLLSAGAAFGLLVLVFQHTWAQSLLGFRSNGAIVAWIPTFLFVVLFGLSMDYHVFVVARIREGAAAGLSTAEAVRAGITRSAGVVTSAATVMIAVFTVFAALPMIEFKQLGVGLAAAILIDAVVVRVVLLPAVMTLLGRRNWWPGELSRLPAPLPAEVQAAAGALALR